MPEDPGIEQERSKGCGADLLWGSPGQVLSGMGIQMLLGVLGVQGQGQDPGVGEKSMSSRTTCKI